MKHSIGIVLSVGLYLCGLSGQTDAATQYRITRISPEDPTVFSTIVTGLNDKGEVVGTLYRTVDGETQQQAFLWRGGEMTFIRHPDSSAPQGIFAHGINNQSVVIGEFYTHDGSAQGFIWRRGQITNLPPLAGAMYTRAEALNDRGQIVGWTISEDQDQRNMLLEQGAYTLLEAPATGGPGTGPQSINEPGQITGDVNLANGFQIAALWQEGDLMTLSTLPNAHSSQATDINNRGEVVGIAIVDETNESHAWRWREGRATELPGLLPDHGAYAFSINNDGVVAGMSVRVYLEESAATIWENGRVIDLNGRIAANDPLKPFVRLGAATRINDLGQIVATGIDERDPVLGGFVYLLTPVE